MGRFRMCFAAAWGAAVLSCSLWVAAQEKAAEPAQDAPAAPPAAAAPAAAEAEHAEKGKDDHAAPAAEGDHAAHADHAGDSHAGDSHAAESHAAGHHDPYDVGHGNASKMLEDPSQWKADLAVATFIVFLLLLALLSKFAWRPVMQGLEARENAIAANIEEAKRSAERAAAQLRQYELKLAAATEEARGILDQARRDADAARERIISEAQEVAQRERQRAVDDIGAAKNVALQEMTQKSVDLAVSLAGRLIRKQLRPEDHAQLIREAVEQFPSRN